MMDDQVLDDVVPEGSVLRVHVGAQSLSESLQQAQRAMQAAQTGAAFEPLFSVGFEQMGQMLAVFTPKRLDLIAALRSAGPSSVRALARRVGRDYKNVHGDVAALEQWMAVQRLDDGRVSVPWREIVINMTLPEMVEAA